MDPPEKPDETDCCNSGCHPCIFDVYEQQLKRYEDSLKNPIEQTPCSNCLDQLKYTRFKLISKKQQTSDVYIFIFEYTKEDSNNENKVLFYKPGQHFLIKAYSKRDRNNFTRAYTPIPWENLESHQFAVLIRLYENGEMSNYLGKMKIGCMTHWRGPYGDYEFNYLSKNLLIIAQGTGIAPIYSVLIELLKNEDCETVVKLFYCCRDCDDILLRNELYDLCKHWNFTYEVFVSRGVVQGVKYNEVVHGARLEISDLKKYLGGRTDCEFLICGSVVFEGFMSDCAKKCGATKVYLF